MNTKHTPGPWHVEKQRAPNGGTYYRIRESDAQANDCIAQCGPWTASRDGWEANWNAILIAAAPDLLAALEAYVERYSGAAGFTEVNARAALAKAKGE